MTETELKENQIGERVTALEHDVRAVGQALEDSRAESKVNFETLQKRSDENFNQVWRSQEALRQDISSLVSKIQSDTGAIAEKVAAGRQVNWPLLVAGAGLMTAVIGLFAAGMQQYVKACTEPLSRELEREREYRSEISVLSEKHLSEMDHLRDQVTQSRTASMIAEAVGTIQGNSGNGSASK